MSFSLRPHQLVAHWVPGFMLLLFILALRPSVYKDLEVFLPPDSARIALGVVLAFVLGQLLDAVRNVLEELWDQLDEIKWEFFLDADRGTIDKLEDFYFTYYVFSSNLALPLFGFYWYFLIHLRTGEALASIVATIVSVWDSISLRIEIARLIRAWRARQVGVGYYRD